jgi:hypothetical protein
LNILRGSDNVGSITTPIDNIIAKIRPATEEELRKFIESKRHILESRKKSDAPTPATRLTPDGSDSKRD